MGIFSSSYKTSVATSVSRVIADNMYVPAIKTGIVTSLISNDGQLVEQVLENIVSSIGNSAERMFVYAKSKYAYGVPSSKILSSATGESTVKGVLQGLLNSSITIDYYHFGVFNNLHYGWQKLCDVYQYTSTTNELPVISTAKGYPAYLNDMVVVVKEATLEERIDGSLEQWGTGANSGFTPDRAKSTINSKAITPFAVDDSATTDYLHMTYVWSVPTVVVIQEEVTKIVEGKTIIVTPEVTTIKNISHLGYVNIPIEGAVPSADYVHVKFNIEGKSGYWTYRLSSNTQPLINAIYSTEYNQLGSFFPITYFRLGKTSMDVLKGTDKYKTSEKLTDYLKLDYAGVIEAINSNPDIKDVEQAMMLFGVPADTVKPLEQKYLFDFFTKMHRSVGGVGVNPGGLVDYAFTGDKFLVSSMVTWQINTALGKKPPKISIIIQDKEFKMALSCDAIFKKSRAGVIGAINTYTSSVTTVDVEYYYLSTPISTYEDTFNQVEAAPPEKKTWVVPMLLHTFRYQISDYVYEEIQVYALKMTYYIYGEYTTTGDGTNKNILLIPLDYSITNTYKFDERESLYTTALHFVFNSRVITEVKWYQSGFFQTLLMIAAIVWTAITLGEDGGYILSLVSAGYITIETAIIIFALKIVFIVAKILAIKLFVKVVGIKAAFLIAIATALVSGYYAIDAGSLAGSPFAQELLSLANGLTSGITDNLKELFEDLIDDYGSFQLLADTKIKLLDDANQSLRADVVLNPFVIFGESPDAFYNRTVHSGNIGILGIDSVASFCDVALTLPTLTQTLQGDKYV